jgi:alcohol dehydrogenase (cytochrome c)
LRIKLLGLALLVLLAVAALALISNRVYALMAARIVIGKMPDMTWADLNVITRPDLGFDLDEVAWRGDPYKRISNPFNGVEIARARGKEIFANNCSKCHGPGAKGGMGPALFGRTFTHGSSDWALYHTITAGVPGTAMVGDFIDRADVWLVIAYLRGLQTAIGAHPSDFVNGATSKLSPAPEITSEQLLASSDGGGEWLVPTGGYDGQRFSRDSEINVSNVSRLAVQWTRQFPTAPTHNESVPVVAGDYMYVTVPPGWVYALDVHTGNQVWRYFREGGPGPRLSGLATVRGVAVLGRRVYVGTLDAHLIALDASTGTVVWDRTVGDFTQGYSLTSAPLAVGDLIVTGTGGGEFATPPGYVIAYDAKTGEERWRFTTIPEAGQPGSETWKDPESWKGGAAPWGVGSYDPELGLLYWGVGTANPDYNGYIRPGDNLYANCMLALDVKTGKLKWHFQFTPNDDRDWDSIQTPALIDVEENGVVHKWLAVANRNGFFYVLDRETGAFIRGAPFAKVTWALGLSPTGRPILARNAAPSPQGTYLSPSVAGGTNWWPSAYSPLTQLYYVDAVDGASMYFQAKKPDPRVLGKGWLGGTADYPEDSADFVRAMNPMTAKIRWERRNTTVTSGHPRGGLLVTAGGLLFGSDGPILFALDASSGEQLWSYDTGGHIAAAPITYRRDGHQTIAVAAGQDVVTLALLQPAPVSQATSAASTPVPALAPALAPAAAAASAPAAAPSRQKHSRAPSRPKRLLPGRVESGIGHPDPGSSQAPPMSPR